MPQPTYRTTLGVAKEAAYVPPALPVGVAPTMFVPWKTLTPKDDFKFEMDTGVRGAPVEEYGAQAGVTGSSLDFGGDVFADGIGFPLAGCLGDVVVSGTYTGSGTTTLSAGVAAGVTSITTALSIANGTTIQIDTGVLSEVVVTTGPPTGAGPFTIPVPALKNAHLAAVTVQPVQAPFTHAHALNCAGNTQPVNQTWTLADPINVWQYTGMQFSEVGFKWNADGLLEYAAKALGFPYLVGTSTSSYTNVTPDAAWVGITQVGGTPVFVQDGEVNIKRAVTAVRVANGLQSPYRIWSGKCSVEGKLTLVMEDLTQFNHMINNDQPAFDQNFTQGAGATLTQVRLHSSKAAFTVVDHQYGKDFIEAVVTFRGLANVTDAGVSGGYSPIKATLQNAVLAGTYK